MKRCSKCGAEKPREAFPRETRQRDGRSAECRKCKSEREARNRARISAQQKRWEQENPDKQDSRRARYTTKHAARVKARSDLNHAVERGEVTRPATCERCGGGEEIHAHHRDYSKPLEVEWLCRRCHFDRHNED